MTLSIITAAITEGVHTLSISEALPVTPDQIGTPELGAPRAIMCPQGSAAMRIG